MRASSFTTVLSLGCFALGLGCGGGPGGGAVRPLERNAVAPQPTQVPVASAPVVPVASVVATAQPSAPPTEPSPFFPVAIGGYSYLGEQAEADMHPMDNALFFSTTSYLVRAQGDELVPEESVLGGMGLKSNEFIDTLMGSWPDDAWVTITSPESCDSTATVSLGRWARDKWVRVRSKAETLFGASRWLDGTTLLLTGVGYQNARFSTATVKPGLSLPVLPAKVKGADGSSSPFLPEGMDTAADGSVLVWGTNEAGDELLGHWFPGQAEVQFELAPDACGPDGGGGSVADGWAGGRNQLVAVGSWHSKGPSRGYIASYDGSRWSCELLDAGARETSAEQIAGEADGTLWLVIHHPRQGNELLRKAPGGAWAIVPMPVNASSDGGEPDRMFPAEVFVRGVKDVWLAGAMASRRPAIAHTRPAKAVFALPAEEESRLKLAEQQRPAPATRKCHTLFAMLYTLSKVAPPDYDFPLTREALTGHTEFAGLEFLEAENLGKRYFGAMVRNYDEGLKLVAVVRRGVKGSSPQLICRQPQHVTRRIPFDLKTGALVK